MGLFSSGSKRSSTTNDLSVTTTDNRYTESGIIEGNVTLSSMGSLDNVTIMKTDYGALNAAGDIAGRALTAAENSTNAMRDMAGSASADMLKAFDRAASFATANAGNDENDTVKYLIAAIGIGFAIWAYRR